MMFEKFYEHKGVNLFGYWQDNRGKEMKENQP